MSKLVETLVQEAAEFQNRQKEVKDIFDKYDQEFEKWKGSVLQFEHSQHNSDDDPSLDDRIDNREWLWEGDDEGIDQSAYQENDDWDEGSEEGGAEIE